jgi:hypothetical protein
VRTDGRRNQDEHEQRNKDALRRGRCFFGNNFRLHHRLNSTAREGRGCGQRKRGSEGYFFHFIFQIWRTPGERRAGENQDHFRNGTQKTRNKTVFISEN